MSKLNVTIVSDVVCPWCIVGYLQLQQAANEQNIDLQVSWQPFQLNPNMVVEGQNLREHLIEKYGISVEDSVSARERLQQVGKELDFDFAFSDESRIFNTLDAHKLLTFAKTLDKQHELKMALFNGYFSEQRDISNTEELLELASKVGLDKQAAAQALLDPQLNDTVQQELSYWQQQGISSVPSMVFEKKYLLQGAQGVENYGKILNQIIELQQQEKSN